MLTVTEDQKVSKEEFKQKAIPYIDALYNYALRITGNEKDGRRLLKETYKRASGFYKYHFSVPDTKGWLFRIMRNANKEIFRKKRARANSIYPDNTDIKYQELKNAGNERHELFMEFLNKVTEDEMAGILSSLPEDLKIVIVLADIELFNYDEISDFIDCPEGVVRSRLYKGRKLLFIKLFSLFDGKEK